MLETILAIVATIASVAVFLIPPVGRCPAGKFGLAIIWINAAFAVLCIAVNTDSLPRMVLWAIAMCFNIAMLYNTHRAKVDEAAKRHRANWEAALSSNDDIR